MAHGLKSLTAHLNNHGGARLSKLLSGKQDRTERLPSAAKNGGNALLNLIPKVEQRLSKVEQQRGLCSTLGYTPKGDIPGGRLSSPLVHLLGLSNPCPATRPARHHGQAGELRQVRAEAEWK